MLSPLLCHACSGSQLSAASSISCSQSFVPSARFRRERLDGWCSPHLPNAGQTRSPCQKLWGLGSRVFFEVCAYFYGYEKPAHPPSVWPLSHQFGGVYVLSFWDPLPLTASLRCLCCGGRLLSCYSELRSLSLDENAMIAACWRGFALVVLAMVAVAPRSDHYRTIGLDLAIGRASRYVLP